MTEVEYTFTEKEGDKIKYAVDLAVYDEGIIELSDEALDFFYRLINRNTIIFKENKEDK